MVGLNWIKEKIGRKKAAVKLPEIELEDLWALDYTLANLLTVYLKEFIEVISYSGATPACFCFDEDGNHIDDGWDKWHEVLCKMQYAFEHYEESSTNSELSSQEDEHIQEGIDLFAKYFRLLNY